MDIKQIGLIERIFRIKKFQPIKSNFNVHKGDQVSISPSAIKKFKDGADKRAKEIVMNVPDIRADKVKEVKEKLAQKNYMENINSDVLAESIMKSPFGVNIRVI